MHPTPDPAGRWYSLYLVLAERSLDDLRSDPLAWTLWLGFSVDGQVRNGGWLQAYWNLRQSDVSLADMAQVLDQLGATTERDDCLRLAEQLRKKPRQKALLDEGSPFGAPDALRRLTKPMNTRFYATIPSVRCRLQEYIQTHQEALAESLAQAPPDEPYIGRSGLHDAVHSGNMAWMLRELARGVPVDVEDHDKTTPLCLAMHLGDSPPALEIIDHLIAAGADVNRWAPMSTQTIDTLRTEGVDIAPGVGRLITSIPSDCRKLTRRLLDAGMSATAVDAFGYTALHYVRDATSVRLLVKVGADPNARTPQGVTPLHLATQRMRRARDAAAARQAAANIRALVKLGAVNTVTAQGVDAFWYAECDNQIVSVLFESGLRVEVEPDAEGRHGETALHRQVAQGHWTMVRQLLRVGAPVNALTRSPNEALGLPAGATPLDYAIAGRKSKIRKMLQKDGGISGLPG